MKMLDFACGVNSVNYDFRCPVLNGVELGDV